MSWAVEVCDPVENQRYEISGVAVSDFVSPAFFDPSSRGKVLNWCRTLAAPFTVEPPNGHAVTRSPDGVAQPLRERGTLTAEEAASAAFGLSPTCGP